MSGEYSVCQFFADDSYEYVAKWVTAESAVQRAVSVSRSVGAKLGTTKRIIITDGGDSIAWEWVHGQGVVFPVADT